MIFSIKRIALLHEEPYALVVETDEEGYNLARQYGYTTEVDGTLRYFVFIQSLDGILHTYTTRVVLWAAV